MNIDNPKLATRLEKRKKRLKYDKKISKIFKLLSLLLITYLFFFISNEIIDSKEESRELQQGVSSWEQGKYDLAWNIFSRTDKIYESMNPIIVEAILDTHFKKKEYRRIIDLCKSAKYSHTLPIPFYRSIAEKELENFNTAFKHIEIALSKAVQVKNGDKFLARILIERESIIQKIVQRKETIQNQGRCWQHQ